MRRVLAYTSWWLIMAGLLALTARVAGGEMPSPSLVFAMTEERRVALCHRGDSENRPFCDNCHVEKVFADSGLAAEPRLGPGSDDAEGALTLESAANGPILFEGPVSVIAADESSAAGGKGALRRCGASEAKPYCDGSHKTIAFEAD